MDEKNLVLYCVLKGFSKTANSISTREENLYRLAKVPGNYNSSFFERILEIVKLCVETMGLELACKYLCISPEIARALTSSEGENAFVEDLKGKIVDQFVDQGVTVRSIEPHRPVSPAHIANPEVAMGGTDGTPGVPEQFNSNFIGNPNAKPAQVQKAGAGKAIANPLISEIPQGAFRRAFGSMMSEMPAMALPQFAQNMNQLFNRYGANLPNLPASLPAPQTNNGAGKYAAPSLTVTTSSQTAFNPLSPPQIKRVVNPASLQEHKPNGGNIFNPDYSYVPNYIL